MEPERLRYKAEEVIMIHIEDIELALKVCREEGNNDITLLKCTSAYPAPIEDANLLTIPDMKTRFGCKAGLSDHTMGSTVPMAAVALGAEFIERHYTLDRTWKGTDHAASLEPDGVRKLARDCRAVAKALTYKEKDVLDIEIVQRNKLKKNQVKW